MGKINVEKFIASLIKEHRRNWGTEDDDDDGIIYEADLWIALKDQGLEYKDGEINQG